MGRPSFDELLSALEAPAAPAGGSALAWSAAMAASLVAMAGRGSPAWAGGAAAAEDALVARDRLAALADEDAATVGRLLAVLRDRDADPNERDRALLGAAAVPCEIAEHAAAVAALAAAAASHGKRTMTADAEIASLLARTAAFGATRIVETNLAALTTPASAAVADALRARAASATERAALVER